MTFTTMVILLGMSVVITMFIAAAITQKDVQHTLTQEGWRTEFLGTALIMHHSSEIESWEEAEATMELLDNLHPLTIMGACFHEIQQLGGKLTYKGREIRAASLVDCSGEPLQPWTIVNMEKADGSFESLFISDMRFGY